MKKYYLCLLVIPLAIAFNGCKKNMPSKAGTFYGKAVDLGNGSARSYVTLNAIGNPVSIGFDFTEDMLSGLPTKDGMQNMLILSLPDEAKSTGYDHLELDWNPHGHDPVQIYGLPHFDFHFYIVDTNELKQIIPGPDNVSVDPKYIPKDYMTGVIAVPNMGVHWVDSLASEFQGHTFTATFIYGFYHGKMLFVEPMITKAFLETHPDVTMPVKQPAAFQQPAYYATKWRIHYDAGKQEYRVSLEGLKKQW